MENSDADPQLVAAGVALKLTYDIMASTGLLAFNRDRYGFGFAYEVDDDSTTRIDVHWKGKRVLHVTVNTEPGCEHSSMMMVDDADRPAWLGAMQGAIDGIRLAQLPPASVTRH
jgi:hypothetical protein